MSKVIIFCAPSGSGKSTIISSLMPREELHLAFSISATTRPPRGQEQDGVEYFFLTPEEFRRRIAADEFVEYEEVYADRFYGTLKSQVEKQLADGQNVVFDVDVHGGMRLKEYFGENMIGWMEKMFPDTLILSNGKKAHYHYEEDSPVEISARIEDLMQMRGEHTIAQGKIKVRYDILAPNFRTVQKTWDLTGFWKNTYPQIRKELRGRYPKHPWPETVIPQ